MFKLKRNFKLTSKVTKPSYIPTGNTWKFESLHFVTITHLWYISIINLFIFSHSNVYIMVSHIDTCNNLERTQTLSKITMHKGVYTVWFHLCEILKGKFGARDGAKDCLQSIQCKETFEDHGNNLCFYKIVVSVLLFVTMHQNMHLLLP